MIPILYEKSETEFSGNGICRLRDATSVLVTEERNGIYECSFSYPVNGSNYSQITPGRIIAVEHDTTGDIQPFDIIGFTKPINGVVTFHAVHVSYRLSKSVTRGTNITSLGSAINMLREAVPTNPFVYYPDLYDRTGYLASADGTPRTVREFLGGVEGSILDTYGGEYEWDKFTVYLHPERGQRRDLVVRYGVNLVDYEEEYDGLEAYNAVIPFWKGQDSAQNDIFVVGAMQSSGMAVSSGRAECAALDVTDKFETQPTQAQVEAMGLKVMSETQPFLPIRNFRIDFENENNEYAGLHKCNLCDTIRVVFPRYGMDGYFKIVKVTYDVLQERYTEIELGNLSTTLAEALGVSQFGSDSKPTAGQSASYSGNVLRFGNLRIYIGKVNVANTGRATITFPAGTFSQVITAIPFCGQGGFGGYDTTSVTELTTSKVTLYQYNSAGAAMDVGVVVIGLA